MDARAPAAPVLAPAPALLRAALDASTEAVLLCAADHSIVLVNAAASALLPGLAPGGTAARSPLAGLDRATADGAATFATEHRGRRLLGHRRPLGDDHYGWYLRDTTEEFARAEAFQTAISAVARCREQADITAILRADLAPPELPRPEGIELIGSYQAARAGDGFPGALGPAGGDFYDVFGPAGGGSETVVALGDVCGKGPEAAVLTGKVRQTLRALSLVGTDPAQLLTVLNRTLLGSGPGHRFVTLVVAAISRAGHGRVRMILATGGHPAPLVLRADGTVEAVPVSGTLIGVVPQIAVHPATIELAPGELCLLYSDGLTEARSGTEQYGEGRLGDVLASCHGLPGEAAVARVRRLVSEWAHGGLRDDITMLAIRAPSRTKLSLMGSAPATSPFAIDARRGDRRGRSR
jgi:serine phosphatase RsbU (regulator of sigma subunit)